MTRFCFLAGTLFLTTASANAEDLMKLDTSCKEYGSRLVSVQRQKDYRAALGDAALVFPRGAFCVLSRLGSLPLAVWPGSSHPSGGNSLPH